MKQNRDDYIELTRELEMSLDIDLTDVRKQLVYDDHSGLSIGKTAKERMEFSAVLLHIDISTVWQPPLARRGDFSRTEFVTFIIDKYNYLNRLYVYMLALYSETNISFEFHINAIMTDMRFLFSRILLFRGLEKCADAFIIAFVERERKMNYSNYMFANFRKSKYSGMKKTTNDLINQYHEESYINITKTT